MVATTKTASHGHARLDTEARPAPEGRATAPPRPLPGTAQWVRSAFQSGDGATALPGFALMRGIPVVDAAEKAVDGMAQMQAEMVRFGARRVHRALEAQAEMLACRSQAELRDAQRSYMEGFFEDYVREWSRLGSYAMRVGLGQPVPAAPEPGEDRSASGV
jgi:hypothetical protein